MNHIFAICAYQTSPYLSECIASLKCQAAASPILLCTATPSAELETLANANGLTYCINPSAPNIAGDWNFALAQAKALGADYVTLCHQDDLYLPDYGSSFRAAAARDPDLLIYFTDYGEQRGDQAVTDTRLLNIKRMLLWRLRIRRWQTSSWAKRRTLALGDPICCPSVTYNVQRLPLPLFRREMNCSLDWQTWERLSHMAGRFAYDPKVLMLHRIHAESTTTKVLDEGGRAAQDYTMFRMFWPPLIAKLLVRAYSTSEKSNQL